MIKNTTYKEKFSMLQPWMPLIIDSIKKDLKNEHLKNDPGFLRANFPGKNPSKLTLEELTDAYTKAIAEGEDPEQLAEYIANRWVLKHSDIYYYFEQELAKINPEFSEIKKIDQQLATKIMERAIQQFGTITTYLFCVLNSVVFPEDVYKQLSSNASRQATEKKEEVKADTEKASLETLKRNHDQDIARLVDKYEKKLLGMQKKYLADTEMLKKQIANLQRKLSS
jgi:hypothetical protein